MNQTLSVNEVIKIIVSKTDFKEDQIKEMISETIESMDNMVTEEGAAYVVADNLGVTLESDQTIQAFKFDKLIPGLSNVTIIGRVQKIFPMRTFNRKDGTLGKVQNLALIDNSGTIRVAIWDNKCDIIEQKNIQIGNVIKINGASTKAGRDGGVELSLGLHGNLEVDSSNENEFPEIKSADVTTINKLNVSDSEVSLIAKIIEKRDIIEYERDGKKGRVMNAIISDLTGRVQLTLWHDLIDKFNVFNIGDVIKMTDVRVGENKFNEINVTLNSYSIISEIDVPEYETIKVFTGELIPSLSQIVDNMNDIGIVGKLIEIGDLKEFERNGEKRKVQNITIMDSSASKRVTFWGEDTDKINQFKIGDIIELKKCRTRLNNYSNEIEVNFNSTSSISISSITETDKFKPSEDGISLSSITEVKQGVSIKGIVRKIFDVREITLKDDRVAKVQNFNIHDTEGTAAKVAVWDENIPKIESIEEGIGILLQNVKVKPSSGEYGPEISINKNSIIQLIDSSDIGPVIQTADSLMNSHFEKTSLDVLINNSKVRVQGTIVNVFSPTIYLGCSKCGRKVQTEEGTESVGKCNEHGDVETEEKIIISATLDDSNATTTLKFFTKTAQKLIGMSATDAKDKIDRLSDPKAITNHVLMNDIWVEGKVGYNQERDEQFINVSSFGNVNYSDMAKETMQKFESW